MPKKIRFPLKLADDTQARTLEELREHFDLESVLGHYKSGKLLTWLEDRYLEGEAEAIRALDEAAPDFQQQLCAVFQVEYTGAGVDMEEIERRQERLTRLRTITDEPEYIQNIDSVAFDQEDLADLLDEGATKIYLCREKFTVPASRKGITYVGIEKPSVHISGTVETREKLEITFHECEVDNLPQEQPQSVEAVVTAVRLVPTGRDFELQVDFREPVKLGGREYDHIPVPCDIFNNLEVREGFKVQVSCVGDVISKAKVISIGNGRRIEIPKKCPSCGKALEICDKTLYCSNPDCDESVVKRLSLFLDALSMEGYDEAFIQELIEKAGKSKVRSVKDLLSFTVDDLKQIGMDGKLAKKFPEEFREAIRVTPDYIILGSIGIPGVGPAKAKIILKEAGGWKKYMINRNLNKGDYMYDNT